MTTLRRLLVAVYPIRLFLFALAAWSVAADVCAQSPIRVGYYDINTGAGSAEQEAPIIAAGFTPVALTDVDAASLAGLQVLFVQNSSTSAYGSEYRSRLDVVKAAVNAGLVLIIHDRAINGSMNSNLMSPMIGTRFILPLPSNAVTPLQLFRANGNTLAAIDPTTTVANSPHGSITINLNNGNFSNLGFVNLASMPSSVVGRKGLLHIAADAVNSAATFSYQFGQGFVIYSSIPLDVFLKSLGPAAVNDAFKTIYAPNVLTYAACALKAMPATVTANAATGHYGGTTTLTATVKCGVIPVVNANVTFTLNGIAVGQASTNADGIATLINARLGSLPASSATAIPGGSYPAGVVAAFAGTGLYGASTGTAALTVQKAPASISVAGGTFLYDAEPHAATGTVTGVFGESLGVPTFTYNDEDDVTSDVAPVNTGTYRITASVAETANYLATSDGSSAQITITPKSLVVTADDKSKVYGAAMPTLTATYDGFVAGENTSVLGGVLQLTPNATDASPVDEYRITPSGITSTNYDIAFVEGTLSVTPAPLAVRTADANKIYGAELPAFIAVYEGFVLGETVDALSGSPHFVTDATGSSAVGAYEVTPSGLHSHNYTIHFAAGTLTVSPAPLNIRADDKTKVYGAALPVFTARYEGFVLGETPGALAGTLAFQTNATIASHVGRYPVTPSGLTSRNYDIAFADGYLMVTPAPLTIRANDKERLVGKTNPLLTVSYDGFVLNDTEGILDVRPSVTTTATISSPVGNYPIVAAGASDSNYTIDYVNGDLTISPEGRVHGSGFVDAEGARHHFVFEARETIVLGEKGSLSVRVERVTGSDVFVSQLVTSVVFTNNFSIDPGGKAVVDGVALTGLGTWNGVAATFEVLALDKGEPGVGSDTITLRIRVAGVVVNTTQGALNGGNIQSNRVK